MKQKIIKTAAFLSNSSIILSVGTLVSGLLLINIWQNNNWLEGFLLLLVLSLFFVDRQKNISTEAYLHDLLDNISDTIITIDAQGMILSFNNTVEDMFGYHASELIGQNIKILMPSPYAEMHDSYLANFQKTGVTHIIGQTREVEALRKNGETFAVELWVHKLKIKDKIQFMGIIRDISERQYVDRMKTEFISTVSHELRTPLTSIRGSLGMLKSGVLGEFPPKADRMIDLAHNNTERLINLVNDILDVEKIQAGKMELKFAELNITELVQQSIAANKAYADSYHIKLEILPDIPDFLVYADANRLQQVMANLISNAAKFSPEQGRVIINIEKKGAFIRTSISDQGLGIPEAYRSKLFQKFSQVDSSDTRQKGGTGLGLNITKAIIEHHGGHIDYTTEENIGSTFFFDLLEYQPKTETPTSTTITEVTTHLSQKIKHNGHILVLEDDPDIAQLLFLLLEQQGFKVTTCATTKIAKQLLQQTHFDAMTVDIHLPDQDGLSFIQEFRTQETGSYLPMIIISATAEFNKTSSASALSIIDWIEKPIDTSRLNKALQQAMKKNDAPIRILYIEDNQDLIEMITELLGENTHLIHALTLQSAQDKIKNTYFDLIILDIGLPDGSGLDLLPLINQHKPLIPVIIFSAQAVAPDILQQVDAALVKSQVSNEQLVSKIKELTSPLGAQNEYTQ